MESIYGTSFDQVQDKDGYRWRRVRIGKRLGGELLGASVYELDAGQKSFPYHYHRANEEMLLVIDGQVTVRTPNGEHIANPGDSMVFRRGPEGAHQLINKGDSVARVMMISTMEDPDVAQYPDSGNIGIFSTKREGDEKPLARILDSAATVDYFEGE